MVRENRYFIFDRPMQPSLKTELKKCRNALQAFFYKILMAGVHVKVKRKLYDVSICAIFKNEAPYLREWIEFHRIVGVDHFYLYNNNSEDDFQSVLEPYVVSGLVTLVEWPHNHKQMECYMDCIARFRDEAKWIGFIDIDEFVVPKSTNHIYDFLRKFERNYGSVCIYWRLFGSSGKVSRNMEKLITEDMVVCWPKYCDLGKCFYNTAFGFRKDSAKARSLHHWFWSSWRGIDIPPVNAFGELCFPGWNIARNIDFPIQINHYFTKSYEEYAVKKSRGDVYFGTNPHDEKYFYEHEMKCTYSDYSSYKYLIKLKLAMKIGEGGG